MDVGREPWHAPLGATGYALEAQRLASKSWNLAYSSAEFASQRARAAASTYLQLPLSFEANQGQTAPQVGYLARGQGYSLFLSPDARPWSTSSPPAARPRRTPPPVCNSWSGNSDSASSSTADPLPGVSNYFVGDDPSQWHTSIATYGEVDYQNVYPGVNLDYYGNQGELEYDVTVTPGADPGCHFVHLIFKGRTSVALDPQGNPGFGDTRGNLTEEAPILYQNINGVRQTVSGRLRAHGERRIRSASRSGPTTPRNPS